MHYAKIVNAALLVLLLAACGASTPAQNQNSATNAPVSSAATNVPVAAPATVRWSVWGSAEELASHEEVAKAFMAAHPEITVKVEHTPWDGYHTKLKTLVAAGDRAALADVIFLAEDFGQYAEQGVLEDLKPLAEKSDYNLGDYWPTLIENATVDGKLYGLQRDLDMRLLYYNKDLFDKAGVAYPTDKWTWDDWADAATKLTVVEASGRVAQQGIGMEIGKWGQLLAQSGGSYLDDPRNPAKCTIDTPASARAITFFADLLAKDAAMRPANLEQIGGDAAAFQQGKVAMIVQNASRAPTFNTASMNYDVAPVPIPADGKRVNNSGGARFVMSSASPSKDAAWTFMSWLQGPDGGQKVYTERGDMFPALRSVAESPAFQAIAVKPANRQAFVVEAANVGFPSLGNFPEFSELNDLIIEPNLQKIWTGESQPDQVVPGLCQQVNEFLKQNGYPKP